MGHCDVINLISLCLKKKIILLYITLFKSEDTNSNKEEFFSLISSAGINITTVLYSNLKIIHPKYFIGTGKLLELQFLIKEKSISTVLFNCALSASQERNLTHFLRCKVVDRNQLILNIFARRARTYEGKLQVKLAQLRYLNSRLVHEWNHLERQTGGIGIRGGPGEMQLESDRRLLSRQMTQVLLDLKRIKNQRENNRIRRRKSGVHSISLVGYTNAGKSTLFNVLTKSKVKTSKNLFVTLDPTCRCITNFHRFNVVLIDTVGFIQNLPVDLIVAFKATLEETMQSALLLHVVDFANEKFEKNIDIVNQILLNMNVNNIPILVVMNKIDQIINEIHPRIDRNDDGVPIRVWISAKNNLGIDLLKVAIDELLPKEMVRYELKIPISHNNLYQHLYQLQAIEECCVEDKHTLKLKVCLSFLSWNRLLKQYKSLSNYII